ncbi:MULTISPECIES: hypothetical protein [unclassified Bacillus (in: firmicutes)]|uniref:hypothetical protein n=1 Tax=unclassified Bacillus (in: firmicutes) TaxID=185979 RepID=UPI001BECF021|nr:MULTISPECIES: hypothetical protein [unclassified Bacillus (in: firmicutes)]MBT2617765.1 hypothetical protein [Bacillus sp. ISL-78]MBT2629584.1 hypothetical protein [Bacillus sp. ISL-101]
MRLFQIKNLAGLYNTFFLRKILNFGVLKSPLIRVLLLLAFIILLTFISFSIFSFFSESLQQEETVLFLLNTYSTTIILWTLVVTIFLKIVFSKVDGFLRMTINFPINSKERNFSVFLYETFISFVTIFLLSFSVVLSIVLIHKFDFATILIVNLIYVSTFTYLVLQVISKMVSYICYFLRIPKLFHVLNLSILVFIFALFFREAQGVVKKLADDFTSGTNEATSFLLFFQYVHQEYGFLLTTIIYGVLVTILVGVIIIIPDNSYMSNAKNILIARSKSIRLMKAYVLSSLRNMNTLNTVALIYLAAITLVIFQLNNLILYAISILAFNSIYTFINSQNLRLVMYRFSYVVWEDYFYMVGSQITIIFLASLPILLPGIIIVDSVVHLIYPYLVVILGVQIFVLAGILFPPYNDNPFSVVTSIIVVTVPVFIISIALSFLNLGLLLNSLLILFFYIVIILFSIQGLINIKRSLKNEKDVYNH